MQQVVCLHLGGSVIAPGLGVISATQPTYCACILNCFHLSCLPSSSVSWW